MVRKNRLTAVALGLRKITKQHEAAKENSVSIKNGEPMTNGKRFNRTTSKYADKSLSKQLFDSHPKANEKVVYEFRYTLKGECTRKYNAIVQYSLKNFVNKDELDITIKAICRDGVPFKYNNAEREEVRNAALNDYFIKHAA